ncbi:MAG: cytochrome-c peroxidase [Myxococcaceae bacterium]|nr:cytochrome-c peroxidase [Myxococcaceae bacterium]
MRQFPLVVAAALLCGCPEPLFPSDAERVQILGLLGLKTPPRDETNKYGDDPAAATLGKALFEEPGLSRCGTLACVTCHAPPVFADRQKLSQGCGGLTTRNTPSVLNQAFRRWYYWDGRKDSVWSHAVLPITRDIEMNQDVPGLRAFLATARGTPLAAQYKAVFGVEPAAEKDDQRLLTNLTKALAAYMRTLVATQSQFDADLPRFLAAVDRNEEPSDPLYLPLKVFVRTGRCIACHKGPMFADDLFHNLGLDDQGTHDPGHIDGIPLVRDDPFNGAGAYSDNPTVGKNKLNSLSVDEATDRGAFRTASLRNIALTAPYMHTGHLKSLDEVIDFYDRGGDAAGTFQGTRTSTIIPLHLKAEEKAALKQLLEMLTDTRLK